MEVQTPIITHFIIIDDDPVNNLICDKIIKSLFSDADVQSFTDPQKGLDYICTNYDAVNDQATILFLDINMPVLNGWEVLDRLMDCADVIKSQFSIFILSSSIAINDRQQADDHPGVKGFLIKPLTVQKVHDVAFHN